MNLILFEPGETGRPIPPDDPRVLHLRRTLRREAGEPFDAGVIDGPRGKGRILHEDGEGVHLAFEPGPPPEPLLPVTLLAGLPRPQTARRILREAASFGTHGIHFMATDRGEPSYAESSLWSNGEVRRHLIAGTEQRFSTLLPEVVLHAGLAEALDLLLPVHTGAALDNYEAAGPLSRFRPARPPVFLAVGSERGWSARERDLFRERGVPLLKLGEPVLRSETACLCGLTLLLAALEFL